MEKAPGNKVVKRCKWYGKGKQALFPVKQVITDHGADIAFVYTGTAFHDSRKVMAAFCLVRSFRLVWGRNVGIRDKEGRQEGMCFFTFCAEYTHDAHADWAGRGFQGAVVIGMHVEASRTSTGACELMKLEVCGNRIINFAYFFRHRVEIRQKKGYHNPTGRRQPQSVKQGPDFGRVGFLLFDMLPEYDNTYVKRMI